MKKAKTLLLLFVALLVLSANAFAATVSIPASSGDPEGTYIIPINIDNAAGVAGYQFAVTYNSAVLNCTAAVRGSLTASWDAPTNNIASGEIRTLSIGPTLTGGSGSLATITCTVVGVAGAGTSLHFVLPPVESPAMYSDVTDEMGDSIAATYVDGSFTINCTPTNGGVEICDGIDNDCNGTVDGITRPTTCGVGACASTGIETCTMGVWGGNTCTPGASTPEVCVGGIDDDCDGLADCQDTVDCSSDAACIGAETNCFDGLDNNGNGLTDCAEPDCNGALGPATVCGVGACAATGRQTCVNAQMVDTCIPGTPTVETCNGIDDNCNGTVDEDLTRPTTCGVGACASTGIETCTSGVWGGNSCTPGNPMEETCNGIDDDCNGQVDNGLTTRPTTCGVGACESTGTETCTAGVWGGNTCTTGDPTGETCNGIDDDCDGQIDNGIEPVPTTCGVGACASTGEKTCLIPVFSPAVFGQIVDSCTPGTPQTEGPFGATCSDKTDNDCDGSTDADDSDCAAPSLDMSQWLGRWFSIKRTIMVGAGDTSVSTLSAEQSVTNGYAQIWKWDPKTEELYLDYYESVTDEGIWYTGTHTLHLYAGTDARFLFWYYRSDEDWVFTFTGVVEGTVENGILKGARIETLGGFQAEVRTDNTLHFAGAQTVTGEMLGASEVPTACNIILAPVPCDIILANYRSHLFPAQQEH